MYKSLEDLMAGIYEMAAPDGIICKGSVPAEGEMTP